MTILTSWLFRCTFRMITPLLKGPFKIETQLKYTPQVITLKFLWWHTLLFSRSVSCSSCCTLSLPFLWIPWVSLIQILFGVPKIMSYKKQHYKLISIHRCYIVYLWFSLQFPWIIFVIKRHIINWIFWLFLGPKTKGNDLNPKNKNSDGYQFSVIQW